MFDGFAAAADWAGSRLACWQWVNGYWFVLYK
jgi:hypothetical protein